ncbi:hypothetical protein VTK73DRAFT_4362 [Phialemonium thermophilum]|uniref:Oxidation resistance protein 1 n=1 Tax=Phialemonium thermophilum TaxID=223376 RepID=A0ABR3Y091_9PEZI
MTTPSSRSHSPLSSSTAATPTGTSANSSTFLSSSVSNLWGGLIRRFSSEMTTASDHDSASSSDFHSSFHSAKTYPTSATSNGVDGVYTPPKVIHRTASPMQPPPLEPLSLHGFRDDTPAEARLLTPAIAEEIRIMVPARLSIVDDWNLVYSLEQDGASLTTLYEKCAKYQGKRVGFVLAVKDQEGGIFGAYLSDFPHPAPSYYGTGECFLWRASVTASLPPPPSADTTNMTRTTTIAAAPSVRTFGTAPPLLSPASGPISPVAFVQRDLQSDNKTTGSGQGSKLGIPATTAASTARLPSPAGPSIRFKAFPYSGVNEYCMFCEAHFLSVGAGDGRYGLWLDGSLERGISSTCLTFGNEPLSDEGDKFRVLGIEVWVVGA